VKRHIRLRGINGDVEGMVWEGDALLRAGRLATLEIVLDDSSVSRRHAELRHTPGGWRVRDLGSTNGTYLNGARLGAGEWPLRAHDIVRCGNVTLVVDQICDGRESDTAVGPDNMLVEASCNISWEEALDGVAYDRNRCPRAGEQMLALLRAGRHLANLESEDELLHSILNDAVSTLDAQRGAIVLADSPSGPLRLRALATGHGQVGSRTSFSQNLAQRSFARGESILCCSVEEDPELAGARSIAEGTMASVLCVLLRTPRKRLGVLHLDRGPLQKPFTKDDLHLADALAANVSAGIESAQLLRKQRELFYNTITVLAQTVEFRDNYTGNHTQRVTEYSLLLADALKEELAITPEERHWIQIGTPLHDIGKIGIDDAILRKPGRLTEEEFEIMKTHTTKGAKILEQVPDLAPVIPIVRSHHERWDGGGYPDGLVGERISKLARIVAVADAFDAMTSDRPYRPGMPADRAFAEVERMRGRQFDPRCAAAFLSIRQRIVQEMQAQTKKLGVPVAAGAYATLRVVT
jgi:HD-GYP domain-containing protein (c-di-GMP phosphodiesterase class II)